MKFGYLGKLFPLNLIMNWESPLIDEIWSDNFFDWLLQSATDVPEVVRPAAMAAQKWRNPLASLPSSAQLSPAVFFLALANDSTESLSKTKRKKEGANWSFASDLFFLLPNLDCCFLFVSSSLSGNNTVEMTHLTGLVSRQWRSCLCGTWQLATNWVGG